jgi:hypothetical protein
MEITGVGYYKHIKTGEIDLQVNVVNIWKFPPNNAFTYYNENGIQFTLEERTGTGDDRYSVKTLSKDEVTQEMKDTLILKGYLLK